MTASPAARLPHRLRALSTAVAVAFAYLVAVEIVLRFLPVATGLHSLAVDAASPIFHYEPNREFVYSRGWNLRDVVRGRINNDGWVNEQDYTRDDKRPLIAIIGDSYIEAQMVPYAATMQGRLAAALQDRFRVYSFAASGAPLSEFAVYARYAVRVFGAAAVVFNLANYDFAASDGSFGSPAGMWIYEGADDDKRLRLLPYRPSWARELARHSALARYLLLNLGLDRPLAAAHLIASLNPTGTALADEPADPRRLAAAEAVSRAFFRDLPRLVDVPRERVLFVMDGSHYPDQAAAGTDGYDRRVRRYFAAAAAERGYETVDLEPIFLARYRESGATFELPGDPHWSAAGHAVAAEGVLSSRLIRDLQ